MQWVKSYRDKGQRTQPWHGRWCLVASRGPGFPISTHRPYLSHLPSVYFSAPDQNCFFFPSSSSWSNLKHRVNKSILNLGFSNWIKLFHSSFGYTFCIHANTVTWSLHDDAMTSSGDFEHVNATFPWKVLGTRHESPLSYPIVFTVQCKSLRIVYLGVSNTFYLSLRTQDRDPESGLDRRAAQAGFPLHSPTHTACSHTTLIVYDLSLGLGF